MVGVECESDLGQAPFKAALAAMVACSTLAEGNLWDSLPRQAGEPGNRRDEVVCEFCISTLQENPFVIILYKTSSAILI